MEFTLNTNGVLLAYHCCTVAVMVVVVCSGFVLRQILLRLGTAGLFFGLLFDSYFIGAGLLGRLCRLFCGCFDTAG